MDSAREIQEKANRDLAEYLQSSQQDSVETQWQIRETFGLDGQTQVPIFMQESQAHVLYHQSQRANYIEQHYANELKALQLQKDQLADERAQFEDLKLKNVSKRQYPKQNSTWKSEWGSELGFLRTRKKQLEDERLKPCQSNFFASRQKHEARYLEQREQELLLALKIQEPVTNESRFRDNQQGFTRVAPYKDTGEQSSCITCLEPFILGEPIRIYKCEHQFHLNCSDSWAGIRIQQGKAVTCPHCAEKLYCYLNN